MRRPTIVDLYSGCGGVTAALRHQRFRVVAAIDNDPLAGKTYTRNNKGVHLYSEDIRTVDPENIRQKQLKGMDLDLLIVCSPCQPFSNQNRNRENDSRGGPNITGSTVRENSKAKDYFF